MSNYGSKTKSTGEALEANSSKRAVLVGEKVKGNKLVFIGMDTDKEGNEIENRACIKFEQSNGATFKYNIFDSDQEWAIDNMNANMLHIATKVMDEAAYYAALGSPASFKEFITKAGTAIMANAAGKTFTLKIVYQKGYPSFPKFPNFMELDGTNPSTLSTNAKYDHYTIITKTDVSKTADSEEEEF